MYGTDRKTISSSSLRTAALREIRVWSYFLSPSFDTWKRKGLEDDWCWLGEGGSPHSCQTDYRNEPADCGRPDITYLGSHMTLLE